MLGTVTDLLHAWRDALPTSATVSAVSRAADELLSRWSEPHRHYHTVEHLDAVLSVINSHADRAVDPDTVKLAAWFHDAVYDPLRVDNEEASALLAEAMLPELSVPPAQVAEVARLVRVTAGHDPLPGDRNGGLLVDADLAILAASPETYRAYTIAIRREYAHLDDGQFAAGRAGVLNNLLNLPRLFHTPVLRERWEDLARSNITAELAGIRVDLGRTGVA
jgi:predicted metal-dependent HD superfamily phosphohydrolase